MRVWKIVSTMLNKSSNNSLNNNDSNQNRENGENQFDSRLSDSQSLKENDSYSESNFQDRNSEEKSQSNNMSNTGQGSQENDSSLEESLQERGQNSRGSSNGNVDNQESLSSDKQRYPQESGEVEEKSSSEEEQSSMKGGSPKESSTGQGSQENDSNLEESLQEREQNSSEGSSSGNDLDNQESLSNNMQRYPQESGKDGRDGEKSSSEEEQSSMKDGSSKGSSTEKGSQGNDSNLEESLQENGQNSKESSSGSDLDNQESLSSGIQRYPQKSGKDGRDGEKSNSEEEQSSMKDGSLKESNTGQGSQENDSNLEEREQNSSEGSSSSGNVDNQESLSNNMQTYPQESGKDGRDGEKSSSEEEQSSMKDGSLKGQGSQGNVKQENSGKRYKIKNKSFDSRRDNIDKLKRLRDRLKKLDMGHKKLVKEHLTGKKKETYESEEEVNLSSDNREFLDSLNELPSFEDRDRGGGYVIDTSTEVDVSESVIRTLIVKFLNQRFCNRDSDLNIRSNNFIKSDGFYKWDIKNIITHLETEQINRVLLDKYGYEYAEGDGEKVPLSFYFDMSGSMANYSSLLAVIAIELLKKNVKVLVGFNERVNIQINYIDKSIDVEEFSSLLSRCGNCSFNSDDISSKQIKIINRNIDNYLLGAKAEKCFVFSDFDPRSEIINLSNGVQVYWFCFEKNYNKSDLSDFQGFIYNVSNINDIADGLVRVNQNSFKAICYIDKNVKSKR